MDLLQLWQSICVEAGNLAAGIEQLPDLCESGDADAHLSGRCSHCGNHMPAGNAANRLDCLEILSRLRADLAMLNQDMSTAVPARIIGEHSRGVLRVGNQADLILSDDEAELCATYIGGTVVHGERGFAA